MKNTGFVVYNTFLNGYLTHDKCFTENIALAKINPDKGQCRSDMSIVSNTYKEVPSFDSVNMIIKEVVVTLNENQV